MLLEGKNAVIHGAGGAIGGAVARAFAREGATVFLAGRTPAKLDAVANQVASTGGVAQTAQSTRWTRRPSNGTPRPSPSRREASTSPSTPSG